MNSIWQSRFGTKYNVNAVYHLPSVIKQEKKQSKIKILFCFSGDKAIPVSVDGAQRQGCHAQDQLDRSGAGLPDARPRAS
jgi:hypothetical protein